MNIVRDYFSKVYKEHMDMFEEINKDEELRLNISRTAEVLYGSIKQRGQILLCGNGGSAADAQHIATEFVSKFYLERKPINAEAITVNTSTLTAISNDYTYDRVFSRQVEAKAKKGDVLIGLSTSGNSINVIEAMKTAKEMGLATIAFTGRNKGSKISKFADIQLNAPSDITPRIQEAHIFIGHLICEIVEDTLFSSEK